MFLGSFLRGLESNLDTPLKLQPTRRNQSSPCMRTDAGNTIRVQTSTFPLMNHCGVQHAKMIEILLLHHRRMSTRTVTERTARPPTPAIRLVRTPQVDSPWSSNIEGHVHAPFYSFGQQGALSMPKINKVSVRTARNFFPPSSCFWHSFVLYVKKHCERLSRTGGTYEGEIRVAHRIGTNCI